MNKFLGIDLGASAIKLVAVDGSVRSHQLPSWREEPLGPEFLPGAEEDSSTQNATTQDPNAQSHTKAEGSLALAREESSESQPDSADSGQAGAFDSASDSDAGAQSADEEGEDAEENDAKEAADKLPQARSWEDRALDALQVLKEEGWLKAENIACALPSSLVATHLLSLPFGDMRKVEQTLPFELEEAIPFELDEVVFDYQVLSREPSQTTLLVAVVRKEAVKSTLELLAKVGVDPGTLTFSAASLMHLAAGGYLPPSSDAALKGGLEELAELPQPWEAEADGEDGALDPDPSTTALEDEEGFSSEFEASDPSDPSADPSQAPEDANTQRSLESAEDSADFDADSEFEDSEEAPKKGLRRLGGGWAGRRKSKGAKDSKSSKSGKRSKSAGKKASGRGAEKPASRRAGRSRAGSEAPSEVCALIDIGHKRSGIVIIDGDRLGFARSVSSAGAEVTAAIARALGGVSLYEAEKHKHALASAPFDPSVAVAKERAVAGLIREIRATFAAWHSHSQRRVQRIVLCGGGSRLWGIEGFIQDAFDLPVELLEDLNKRPLPNEAGSLDTQAQALSLGLHAAGGRRQLRLNFRRGEFAYTHDVSSLRLRSRALMAMAAVLALLLGANAWAKVRVLSAEEAQLDAILCETTQKILGSCESDYRVALGKLKGQGSPAAAIPKISASDMALSVANYFPPDKDATLMELEILDSEIRLRGDAASYDVVEDVVGELQKSRCFGEVRKGRLIKKESRIEFDIDARYTCTQPGEDEADS